MDTFTHPYIRTQEGHDRFIILRDFLEKDVPDRLLRMLNWVRKPGSNPCIKCNTAGCAVGWACTIPKFNKMGLNMSHEYLPFSERMYSTPNYKGFEHMEAVHRFFGIGDSISNWLFLRSSYKLAPKVKDVVARIDWIIAGKLIENYKGA